MWKETGLSVLVIALLLPGSLLAREPDFREFRAVQESLSRVRPRQRASWLREHRLDDSYYTQFRRPDSSGLRCVGRWPWGPSWELCGRDSLLFLGSGSGVRILSIADSVHPRQLGQIAARGLINQLVVRDSLLFVACGSWGAQVYSVSDPANPRELGSMDAVIKDLTLEDTLCYTIGADTFRVFDISNPATPEQVGALRDSGDCIAVANGHAFLGDRWVMDIVNVTDPTRPVWVGSRGGEHVALLARGDLLYYSSTDVFRFGMLDITDPTNIRQLGTVSGVGGQGLYVRDSFAYLSAETGSPQGRGLRVIDVSDSAAPVLLGRLDQEGIEFDPYVVTTASYGYLASDFAGLRVLDLHAPGSPQPVSDSFACGWTMDIDVQGPVAYVAEDVVGVITLDLTDPTAPTQLGSYESLGHSVGTAIVARDSFAYASFEGRAIRVLDVSDPSTPVLAARLDCFAYPQDMVLRDSLLYMAEGYKFQVVNVARPRSPVLVGSCNITGTGTDLLLMDTLAYVSSLPSPIVSISDPAAPRIVGSLPLCAYGVVVIDTFAIAADGGDSLWIGSVSNPASPRRLDCIPLTGIPQYTNDIELAGTRAYTAGSYVHVLDVSNPALPLDLARVRPPYVARRVVWDRPYLYVACWDAGVCIYESTAVGVAENNNRREMVGVGLQAEPSVTRGVVRMVALPAGATWLVLRDAAGREVGRTRLSTREATVTFDLSRRSRGVYFVEVESRDGRHIAKVVKN